MEKTWFIIGYIRGMFGAWCYPASVVFEYREAYTMGWLTASVGGQFWKHFKKTGPLKRFNLSKSGQIKIQTTGQVKQVRRFWNSIYVCFTSPMQTKISVLYAFTEKGLNHLSGLAITGETVLIEC